MAKVDTDRKKDKRAYQDVIAPTGLPVIPEAPKANVVPVRTTSSTSSGSGSGDRSGMDSTGMEMDLSQASSYDRGLINRTTAPYGGVDDVPKDTNGFTTFLDNIMPDDLGGLIKGTSDNWLPEIPYVSDLYRNTTGAAFGVVIDQSADAMDWLYWGSEQADHLGSWAFSASPGGLPTLEMGWQGFSRDEGISGQVTDFSAGQSFYSSLGINFNRFVVPVANFATEAIGQDALNFDNAQEFLEDKALFLAKNFEPMDPEQRKIAFEEQTAGKYISGAFDAFWDVAADPAVVLGASSSVLRYGTKLGKFAGLSNVSLSNPVQKIAYGKRMDLGLANFLDPSVGKPTGAFEQAKSFVDNAPETLGNHVWVTNANDQMIVFRLKSMLSIGDAAYPEAASIGKVLVGDRAGWDTLSNARPDIADVLYTHMTGADILAPKNPFGLLDAKQTSMGRIMVAQAKAAIDDVGEVASYPMRREMPGGQIVTRGGAYSARPVRVNAAWKTGKAEGSWGARTSTFSPAGKSSTGWVYDVVRATSASRPVMIARWAGSGRPTNIVHLKGGDGNFANVEVNNWLTHSNIDPVDRVKLFDEFVSTGSVQGRRNVLIKMEQAEVKVQAVKTGLTEDEVMLAYNSYRNSRHQKMWEVRSTVDEMTGQEGQTAFTVTEDGSLLHIPGLYSELDEAFPLLDTKAFQRVVRSNKPLVQSYGKTLDITVEGLDVLNNMWKVSVLLRLGYTMRNITEGGLRSVATVGVLAANPQALGRVPSSIKYAGYKRYYGRRAEAQGRALSDAQQQLIQAEESIVAWRKAAKVEEIDSIKQEITVLEELIGGFYGRPRPEVLTNSEKSIAKWTEEVNVLKSELESTARLAGTRSMIADASETIARKNQAIAARNKKIAEAKKNIAGERKAIEKKDRFDRNEEMARLKIRLRAEDARLVEAEKFTDSMRPELFAINERLIEGSRLAKVSIDEIEVALAKMKAKEPRMSKVGEGGRTVATDADGKGVVYPKAFDGPEGEMARILSSSDSTQIAIFQTGFENRLASLRGSTKWTAIDPADLKTPGDWERYWDNLSDRYNRRYRQDYLVQKWLGYGDGEVNMLENTRRWLMSSKSVDYRGSARTPDDLPLNGANGKADPERVDEFLTEMYRRYTDELPAGFGLRESLEKGPLMPYEVQAKWGTNRPPVIPAPVETGAKPTPYLFGAVGAYKNVTDFLMKALGSYPENKLLRHPYYSAVYETEQLRMVKNADAQGQNLSSHAVRDGINRSAHKEALKQTRQTMYTIERESNASNALRFFIPFFPAWENSIRTWGRIAYRNPAIVGIGNAAWNIPNGLGWVVNEQGEKVEWSNYLITSEEHYISYPENVAKAFAKVHRVPYVGDFISTLPILNTMMPPLDENGEPMPTKTRQSGLNVIFTGGLLNPGLGPGAVMPLSIVLRGKPELVEVIRNNIPDEVFRSLVPSGDPNTDLKDMFLPTTIKRIENKVFAGENENTAYLRLKDTMIQDEIVRAAMIDKQVSVKDMERIIERADKFWNWSIGQAATGFTASTSFNSPFSVERQLWRDLLDNTALTYTKKLEQFIKKIDIMHPGKGEDFLALTRSNAESPFKVNPNQRAYDRLTRDPKLIKSIARTYGEDAVGMYTNVGDWQQPFNRSVYNELRQQDVGGMPVKEKMATDELIAANDVSEGWRQYFLTVDSFDEAAVNAGLGSYKEVKGSDDLLEELRNDLGQKYPGFGVIMSKDWEQNVKNRISTARLIVSEATEKDLAGNQTIRVLSQYLDFREEVSGFLSLTEDADLRKKIREMAYVEVSGMRKSSIGFADFYDRYLENDDFRKVFLWQNP